MDDLGLWTYAHGYEATSDAIEIQLGEWIPDDGEPVNQVVIDPFGYPISLWQRIDGRLYLVQVESARDSTPRKAWFLAHAFETWLQNDGTLGIGFFEGAHKVARQRRALREEDPRLYIDCHADADGKLVGIAILNAREQLMNGHLIGHGHEA